MICQRMMVGGGGKKETWRLRVNTEATAAGEKKTGIPFNLHDQPGVRLEVDWGDGTSSTLTSADYTLNDSGASVHVYSAAGTYTVDLTLSRSKSAALLTGPSSSLSASDVKLIALYWFRRTLQEVVTPIPPIGKCYAYLTSSTSAPDIRQNDIFQRFFAGCEHLTTICNGLFDNNTKDYQIMNFHYVFYGCKALLAIPGGLFDALTGMGVAQGIFYECSALTALPDKLFEKNANISSFISCFSGCTALGNFTLHIGSTSVTSCDDFVSRKAGATRTIYVPSGSTTETTFNAVASSLGLTIIGE